jgi:hypothetical protein
LIDFARTFHFVLVDPSSAICMSQKNPALLERAQQAEQKGNRDTRDLWERFRDHRQRMSAEILALAPAESAGGRLCLLGAGNANDFDLETLAERFDEVHLVDIDPSALSRAAGRQSPAVRGKLKSHAPVDLSGLYHQLERTTELPPADTMVTAGMAEVMRQLPSEFDVVVSSCLVSQMAWALEHLLSPDQLLKPMLEQTMLRIHLRVLLGLLRPTGAALLVSDLTSSQFYPLLDDLAPSVDLRDVTRQLADARAAYVLRRKCT